MQKNELHDTCYNMDEPQKQYERSQMQKLHIL